MSIGDDWFGTLLQAMQSGPDWASTAAIVTWDDCGCFYDHVPPPFPDWGIRVPVIIVSPYAKPGFTDSTDATFVSMLTFAEHVFGLTPLNADDAGAYAYANAFDFTQPPGGPVSVVHTKVPRWEIDHAKNHPEGLDPSGT